MFSLFFGYIENLLPLKFMIPVVKIKGIALKKVKKAVGNLHTGGAGIVVSH